MAIVPLTGIRIQAKGYRRGRAGAAVQWIVLHTAEGATDEVNLGNFFRNNANGSSHAGVGQDGGYATYVNYADTAWTAPPLNEESDQLEICGFARWGRSTWLEHPKMLEAIARWIAWRCAVRKIPIRFVTLPKPGTPGVTGHVHINKVYHKSSHWDPGPQFPWDVVIARAKTLAGVKPPPTTPIVAKPGTHYKVRSGDSYWKIAVAAYKNGAKWPTIAKANGNKPLKPGMSIFIPSLTQPKPPPPKPRIDLPKWPGYGYVAFGKKNSYVQKMQTKLRALGFAYLNPNGATGYYGKETVAMVKAWQRNKPYLWNSGAKGPDGICGPKTWDTIDRA